MQGLIDTVIDGLNSIKDKLNQADEAEKRTVSAELNLKDLKSQHDKVKEDLQKDSVGLTLAQAKSQKDFAQRIMDAQQELRALTSAVEGRQLELDNLTALVASAKNMHDQINDSLTSLRKQIGG